MNYTVMDDFGATLNPLLLQGQVHGGIGQGVGQALVERTVYNDDGQLLTASFMDYAMPRADNLPSYAFRWIEIPCKTNPLGIKGSGEAGAIGAPPAVMNGLLDALSPLGVTHLDMPATPAAVWQAIQAAGSTRRAANSDGRAPMPRNRSAVDDIPAPLMGGRADTRKTRLSHFVGLGGRPIGMPPSESIKAWRAPASSVPSLLASSAIRRTAASVSTQPGATRTTRTPRGLTSFAAFAAA